MLNSKWVNPSDGLSDKIGDKNTWCDTYWQPDTIFMEVGSVGQLLDSPQKGSLKKQTKPHVYSLNLFSTMIKVRYKHTDLQLEYKRESKHIN